MRSYTAIAVLFLLLAGSCSKDEEALQTANQNHTPSFLLDKVEFKNSSATVAYTYNADSTLKSTSYTDSLSSSFTAYSYTNKQLAGIFPTGNPSAEYGYTDGYLTSITALGKENGTPGYRMAFSYAANGLLEEMLFYTSDSTGEHLQTTNLYQYNIDGLPAKITSIGDNVVTTTLIHGYSEECDFNVASLLNPGQPGDLYMIYNYSLLHQLNRLPAEIIVSTAEGHQAPVVKKKYTADFTITNRKLEKIRSVTTYAAHPSSEERDEWVFHYK